MSFFTTNIVQVPFISRGRHQQLRFDANNDSMSPQNITAQHSLHHSAAPLFHFDN